MKSKIHEISQNTDLYFKILRRQKKSVMFSSEKKIMVGEKIRISEVRKKTGKLTGQKALFIITDKKVIPSDVYANLTIFSLERCI